MAGKKVSKTPLKTASFAEQFGGGAALPENDTDLQAAGGTKGPTTEELLARLDEMGKRLEDVTRTNAAMAQPLVTAPPAAPKAPQLDMSGLPDPAFDQEGYTKALAQRVEAFTDAKMAFRDQAVQAAQRETQTREEQIQGLWQDFRIAHPDHTENEDLAGYAAKVVMDRAKARGIDTDRYMFSNRTQFMDDVVKEIEKIAPQKKGEDEVDLGASAGDDEAPTRTGGLFSQPGGPPVARKGAPEAGDMIKDLQDLQRKSGFF